jgi:hypothetical protein
MSSILETQQKFKTLLKIIERQRPGFTESYGDGLTFEEIHLLFPDLFIPDGLLAIYSCISGSNLAFRNSLKPCVDVIPMYRLIPINQITGVIKNLEKLLKEYPEVDNWKPDMIPFMKNESGDYYLIRSLEEDQSIWNIRHDSYESEPSPYCMNMETFIDFTIDCYKSKAYSLGKNSYLKTDFELKAKIREKY